MRVKDNVSELQSEGWDGKSRNYMWLLNHVVWIVCLIIVCDQVVIGVCG